MNEDNDTIPQDARVGVGIVLVNPEKRIFVGQRYYKNKKFKDEYWQMPQGGVEKDEEPEAAALRELEEEVGCKPNEIEVLAVSKKWYSYEIPPQYTNRSRNAQAQRWYLIAFKGSDENINIEQEPREFRNWQWIEHKKVPKLVIEFKKEVYKKVLKDFSWYFGE